MIVDAGVLTSVSSSALVASDATLAAQPEVDLASAAEAMPNSAIGAACVGSEVEHAIQTISSRMVRVSEIALGHERALQVTEDEFASRLNAMGVL